MERNTLLASVNELPTVDQDTLNKLANGNTRLAEELLDMLLAELPAHRAKIHEAYHRADLDSLASLAHTIRGAAAYCAAIALQSASAHLESASRGRDERSVAEALVVFWQQTERLLAARSGPARG